MSKDAPIFDKSDTTLLDQNDLPAELQGKSPQEIASYYKRREAIMLDRIRQQQPPPPPPKKEEPPEEKFDLFNDPAGSVNRVVTRQVNQAMERMSAVATPALVESCKLRIASAHTDYPRFAQEIEKRMLAMTPEGQMNPEFWEMTYKVVKGELADKLASEAVEKALQEKNPVERPTPPGDKPPKPRELSDDERVVARKFGMDDKSYREAADRYEAEDGRFPLTFDSKKPRQKAGAAK